MNSVNGILPNQVVKINSLPVWLTKFVLKIPAGFTTPAEDMGETRIDLTAELITDPDASYLTTVKGRSMEKYGIFDGDLLVINRALEIKDGSIVVAVVDGEVTIKKLYMQGGVVKLVAGNPDFKDITFKEGQELVVWGVAQHGIRSFKT